MKRKKHLFFLILLALVCLVLLGTGTLAAYTRVENVKRVAAVKSSTDELCFSSNYLTLWDGAGDRATKTFNVNQGSNFTIHLKIYNSPQKGTKFSDDEIEYTLSIVLIGENGTEVSYSELLNVSENFADTHILEGGSAKFHTYEISNKQDKINELAKYTIRINATSTTLNKTLAADLKLKITSQSISWKVEPADTGSDFDAFNFDIFGTADETVKLSWPSDLVRISPWAKDDLQVVDATNISNGSITFKVGGSGQPTRYRLQFYKVDDSVGLADITGEIKITPIS